MNIVHAIILGLVEGVTEFLPISSTFHQIFAAKLLGVQETDFVKLFEVVIQAGAIVSAVLLYFRMIITDRLLLQKLAVSFLPTAIVGFVLHKVIKSFFDNNTLMLGVFIFVGVIFIGIEYLVRKKTLLLSKDISTMTYKDAFIIGLIQSFAVVPGVSRAGAVIVGMMCLRFKRFDSAQYSFMLSIPTILAAAGFDALKMRNVFIGHSNDIMLLIIGTVAAFASSYVIAKWLITYLKNNTLTSFGIYRFFVGIILLFIAK